MDKVTEQFKTNSRELISRTKQGDLFLLLYYSLSFCAYLHVYVAAATVLRMGRSFIPDISISFFSSLKSIGKGADEALVFGIYIQVATLLIAWLYILLSAVAWSWFIPFVNLFFPYKILCALKKGIVGANEGSFQGNIPIPGYYPNGWKLLCCGNVLLGISGLLHRNQERLLITCACVLLALAYFHLRRIVMDLERSKRAAAL